MATRTYTRRRPLAERKKRRFRLPRRARTIILIGVGIGALWAAGTVLWWSKDLPSPQDINSRRISESTKIYDRTGEHLLYEIGDIHRTTVSLDNISSFIRQATLAAEDDQFYNHHGLDFAGIARGVILKPLTGQRVQGGSTITQQLIKNAILTPERTIQRKVKEAVLAIELEQRFSKDEILEMYLNDIPYGSQAYGVESAAQRFFDTSAADVTLAQAALLSALPKAPTYYSPYGSRFEALKARQEHIIQRMADLEMISHEQADSAKAEELVFVEQRESIQAPHFVFYVQELLDEAYGGRVIEQGGLTIITTLDMDLQRHAEEILSGQAERLASLGASNAALTAIDPKTGDIVAMAGSLDYFNEEIDGNVNVAIRHRSPGSSIKPFIYAAAFDRGFTPDTILVDAETDFGQEYRPKNYDLSEHGPVTMRQALANSLNIPAVKALYLAGINESAALARAMGMDTLTDPDRYGLSLVLGGGEVRLLDEVSAYGVFANDGLRHPHRAIARITQSDGESLLDSSEEELTGEQVLDAQTARLTTSVLSDNSARALSFGTGTPLQLGSRPVAAKTGTTQEFRDGWTVGYTPSLAVGVWVGNNDNTPMGNRAAGVSTAAPIWNAFMRRALEGQPIEEFVRPEPLTDIPHAIMRGELPEAKTKWESATDTAYTPECPIAVGQPKTFQELHTVLFYVRRTNPRGAPPATAESDFQYERWEQATAAWRDKHNEETKADPNEIRYVASLPELTCDAANAENLPIVRITEPSTTIVRSSPVTVTAEVESEQTIREVRFLLDGKEIARHERSEGPYQAAFSFPADYSGRQSLQVLAVTEEKLIGRAHRTFIVNPDDSPPSVTLHTPQNGKALTPNQFPFTVKVTAVDNNGIEAVDVLYHKEGESGNRRIGRTSTLAPTAPNRYEVAWGDSPGSGTYEVFVIAYDTTGNFTESSRHTITID